MKFLAPFSLLALVALSSALPQASDTNSTEIGDNVIVDIGPIPAAPSNLADGNAPSVSGDPNEPDSKKRGLAPLEKRSFKIQVWQDPRKGGRHQALVTDGELTLALAE